MKIHKNRLLIIGSGNIFKKHISAIQRLKNKFEIAGIVEKDPIKINKLEKNFSFKIYKDINRALKECSFNIGCVLTDSGSHGKITLKLLKNKKNVIIEKPISISLKEAEKIVAVEKREKKLNIFVVKQNRFNVAIINLKKALEKKKLGKIFLATIRVRWKRDSNYYRSAKWRGKWETDGGVLCNQAIHHIDLLQWLVGDVNKVFSMNERVLAPIEAEDTSASVIKFKNGATGIIEATTACRPNNLEGSLSLLGTKGTVIVGGFSADKIVEWNFINKKYNMETKKYLNLENPKNIDAYGHYKFYEYVDNYMRKKSRYNFLNASEALKSLKIVTALTKSSLNKKLVKMNENLYRTNLGKKIN